MHTIFQSRKSKYNGDLQGNSESLKGLRGHSSTVIDLAEKYFSISTEAPMDFVKNGFLTLVHFFISFNSFRININKTI